MFAVDGRGEIVHHGHMDELFSFVNDLMTKELVPVVCDFSAPRFEQLPKEINEAKSGRRIH